MPSRRAQPSPAYVKVRQAIVEGVYAPGQRLVEQRIAEALELSRTPVREALHRLEAEGLVVSEPNRGAVVRGLSVHDIADIYGLRARLEAYAAELAAQRRTAADLAELDAANAAFAAAMQMTSMAPKAPKAPKTLTPVAPAAPLKQPGPSAVLKQPVPSVPAPPPDPLQAVRAVHEANRRLHAGILRAARHDRLTGTLDRTVDVPLVFLAFRHFDRAETERSHVFHLCIRDAIAAADGGRAAALMSEHVLQGRDSLIAHVSTDPAFRLDAAVAEAGQG